MVGGVVTVLFGDGSTASAKLAADGSNAGAIAIVGTGGLEPAPGLNVNGMGPGGVGSYGASTPSVVVSSNPGDIVRVSLTEGFNPVVSAETVAGGQITVEDLVEARLEAQYPVFPVNNAKRWEHEEIVIPQSGSVDVSSLFSLSGDNLPIAYVAVVIDNSSKNPLSETTAPIRLRYSEAPVVTPATLPPASTRVCAVPEVRRTSKSELYAVHFYLHFVVYVCSSIACWYLGRRRSWISAQCPRGPGDHDWI